MRTDDGAVRLDGDAATARGGQTIRVGAALHDDPVARGDPYELLVFATRLRVSGLAVRARVVLEADVPVVVAEPRASADELSEPAAVRIAPGAVPVRDPVDVLDLPARDLRHDDPELEVVAARASDPGNVPISQRQRIHAPSSAAAGRPAALRRRERRGLAAGRRPHHDAAADAFDLRRHDRSTPAVDRQLRDLAVRGEHCVGPVPFGVRPRTTVRLDGV